jgi:hypothetical protein
MRGAIAVLDDLPDVVPEVGSGHKMVRKLYARGVALG